MKILKTLSLAALVSVVPAVAAAQTSQIIGLLNQVGVIIGRLIPIIVGLAVVVFLWGVLMYVISKSEEDKSRGRSYMIWGIIGLFVMVSVWGIVNVLTDAVFGRTPQSGPPTLPHFLPGR